MIKCSRTACHEVKMKKRSNKHTKTTVMPEIYLCSGFNQIFIKRTSHYFPSKKKYVKKRLDFYKLHTEREDN